MKVSMTKDGRLDRWSGLLTIKIEARASNLVDSEELFETVHAKIYESYEELCNQGGLVDFELLLRSYETLLRWGTEALSGASARSLSMNSKTLMGFNTVG